jgi:hypothetical protein
MLADARAAVRNNASRRVIDRVISSMHFDRQASSSQPVGQSSGIELQAAYQGYLTKCASYQSPNLKSDLQAILDQYKNLKNGVTTSPDSLITPLLPVLIR